MVRQSGGMPEEKSRRGSKRGLTRRVDSQLIKATASWLEQSKNRNVKKVSFQPWIASSSQEIHPLVNAGRVRTQSLIDQADGFDELAPVHGAQEAQAGNAMADGNLIGGLVLALEVNQRLDGQAVFCQALLQPGARQMHHRGLAR